jgi:hypothetical protein
MRHVSQPLYTRTKKLSVGAISAEIGLTTRQLARWANKGVPGVERGPGKYQFIWWDTPETRKWIADRKKFRKGKRKLQRKSKHLSHAQRFSRVISRVVQMVMDHLEAALEKPTVSELEKLSKAEQRLKNLIELVRIRILNEKSRLSYLG